MKKLSILMTILFSVMFSSPSWSEWTKIEGNWYVDFDRIRNVDGYVYYWDLTEFPKPIKKYDKLQKLHLILSWTRYIQADCKLFRMRTLVANEHKTLKATDRPFQTDQYNDKFEYLIPNSSGEMILKRVCNHIK